MHETESVNWVFYLMRQTRYILSILYVDIYAIIFKDLLKIMWLSWIFPLFFFFSTWTANILLEILSTLVKTQIKEFYKLIFKWAMSHHYGFIKI